MWRKKFINVLLIADLAAMAILIAGSILLPEHRGEPSFAYRFGYLIGGIWLSSILWVPFVLYHNNKRDEFKTVEVEILE